jgi:hypothetical protein
LAKKTLPSQSKQYRLQQYRLGMLSYLCDRTFALVRFDPFRGLLLKFYDGLGCNIGIVRWTWSWGTPTMTLYTGFWSSGLGADGLKPFGVNGVDGLLK